MSIHNRNANASLTQEEIHALHSQFEAIRAVMSVLPEIDGKMMRRLVKMGGKTQTFSRMTFDLAAQNPGLLPRGLNLSALQEQFRQRDALASCLLHLKFVTKQLDGYVKLMGSDLFSGALAAYNSMKANNRSDSLNESLKELSFAFSRTKKKKPVEEESVEGASVNGKLEGAETRDDGEKDSAERPVTRDEVQRGVFHPAPSGESPQSGKTERNAEPIRTAEAAAPRVGWASSPAVPGVSPGTQPLNEAASTRERADVPAFYQGREIARVRPHARDGFSARRGKRQARRLPYPGEHAPRAIDLSR